jgi:ketosteroid isomerase-like protein
VSRENVETVRLLVERWNVGGRVFDDLADIFDPAFELDGPLASVAGEPYQGHTGIEKWTRDIDEQFSEWHIAQEEVREVGNQVISLGAIRALGRASGIVVEFRSGAVVTFGADGRITRIRLYADPDEALKAVGLEE